MKHFFRFLPLLLCLPLLFACEGGRGEDTTTVFAEQFTMTATVKKIGDKIEVDVIEGAHGATGIYWVNTGKETAFLDKDGERITREALKAGDTVEITYSGQVAMSLPPQIFASSIRVK